ncbi:hypothetical protein N9335_03745 [Crocinitomicaceae bacterium]|nr:hypothetical protein [Crocinitomicaceae bacterium]
MDSTTIGKKKIQEINTLVGPAFSIWESLKQKGVGSPKLHIQSFSQGFKSFIEQNNSTSSCNIELRPKGIIIHQNKRATRLSWVIPYYRLSIFHSDVLSIHGDGEFLKIKKDVHLTKSRSFINKIISHKALYSSRDIY